jgi:two-component system nitrate/nitrite response regulator NarL
VTDRKRSARAPGDGVRWIPPRVEPATPKVLMVEDHKLFTDAVGPALEDSGMEVIGTARDGAEAVAAVRRERPDVVLVDLGLPDVGGLELGRTLLELLPDATLLAVTALNDPGTVREALVAGFRGYVSKDLPLPRFIESVRAAMAGQVVVPHSSPPVPAVVRSPEERHAELLGRQLTSREFEVLGLLVEGATTTDMARRLSVSPNTIRTHVQNILDKLQVRSRLEAAAFAVRHGLGTPTPLRRSG